MYIFRYTYKSKNKNKIIQVYRKPSNKSHSTAVHEDRQKKSIQVDLPQRVF